MCNALHVRGMRQQRNWRCSFYVLFSRVVVVVVVMVGEGALGHGSAAALSGIGRLMREESPRRASDEYCFALNKT